jgi:hypothetical protein
MLRSPPVNSGDQQCAAARSPKLKTPPDEGSEGDQEYKAVRSSNLFSRANPQRRMKLGTQAHHDVEEEWQLSFEQARRAARESVAEMIAPQRMEMKFVIDGVDKESAPDARLVRPLDALTRNGMTAMAVTPALPEATRVGALSAQLRRPRPRSGTSAQRRLRTNRASRLRKKQSFPIGNPSCSVRRSRPCRNRLIRRRQVMGRRGGRVFQALKKVAVGSCAEVSPYSPGESADGARICGWSSIAY